MTPVETRIVRGLIHALKKAGFVPVKLWDSEEYQEAITTTQALDAIESVDAIVTLHFAPKADITAWGRLGVMLVTGNGVDIISDWHCGNESFNAAVESVAMKSEDYA
jgi:hypothetical protein